MKIRHVICGAACAVASLQALACFTVYDRANRVVYHAQTAPVDMRYPIHQTLPRVFPGGHLVMDDSVDCPLYQGLRPDTVGLAAPVYEPPVTPTLGMTAREDMLAVLSPPVPDALPIDTRGMVMTQLSDPPVTLYGRINHPPVR